MTRPMVSEVNVSTQEETLREMNDEEYAIYLENVARFEEQVAKQAEEDAKVAAKQAAKVQALAALGLSQEVVNLLAE
jgi:hypothetical protein